MIVIHAIIIDRNFFFNKKKQKSHMEKDNQGDVYNMLKNQQ